ncbi:hypothetical protein [Rhodopirellula baltica]
MKKSNERKRKLNEKRRKKAAKRGKSVPKEARRENRPSRSESKATIPEGYSTPVMKNFGFDNPLAGLDESERKQIAKELGDKAKQDFDEGLISLVDAIKRHDPEELISTASLYTLFKGVGPGTDFTDEGHYTQALIEVIQSLCLLHPKESFGTTPVLHQYLFEILDLCKQCSKNFGTKRMSAMATCSDEDRAVLMAMEGARMQTQMVRNWGYPQHMKQITRELLDPMEDEIRTELGVGAIEFLDVTEKIDDILTTRIFEFTKQVGEILREKNLKRKVEKFCEIAGSSEEDAQSILEFLNSQKGRVRDKGFFLFSYFHQHVPELLSLSIQQIASLFDREMKESDIAKTMERVSFQFGDLSDENPEHLFMQSKIRTRPFIEVHNDMYFIPILGLLHSFFLELIENLIKPSAQLKDKYHDRRAAYLETSLESLIKKNFAGHPVRTSTMWTDLDDGKTYENDCFVVCGPLAIIFEAKSERVDDSAKRGAPGRLREHYETLVNAPAEQATRFAQLLESESGVRTFQCKNGDDFDIDLTPIRRALCVSVTLDWFPASTLCWKALVNSRLISSANRPSINLSIADLHVVFEVLESPTRRLHYFWRRTEWELNVQYFGDEHDLLVYYLSSGLAVPRDEDGSSPGIMWLYDNSKELHRHYVAASTETADVPPRPRRILTHWWSKLVDRIEEVADQQMWDVACVILDLDYERQREFEKRFNEVIQNVRRKGNDSGDNGLVTYAYHSESLGAVVAFAYKGLVKEDRDTRAGELAHQAHVDSGAERIVVIGLEVTSQRDPYDFIAFVDYSNFDPNL